jgi:hypothetical protein
MSFFCDNKCKILNNLSITNKLYYVAIYLDSDESINVDNNNIKITIYVKANVMNTSGKETSASASLSGTSNTLNGIGNFYITLLGQAVNLIYQTISNIPGFENCNSNNVISITNPVNVIGLVPTDVMKFQFYITNLKVARQGGQTVNAYISYQYDNYFDGFDYEDLRNFVIEVLTSKIDIDTYWENLTVYIAHKAVKMFKPIVGIKINLIVLDNPDGPYPEYGDHGPIFTYGYYLE